MNPPKLLTVAPFAATALIAFSANATEYPATGTVETLLAYDSSQAARNYVKIAGFASAGICAVNGGRVVIRIRMDDYGKAQWSMLLAAKLAGKSVTVTVDTALMDGSWCYLKYLALSQ